MHERLRQLLNRRMRALSVATGAIWLCGSGGCAAPQKHEAPPPADTQPAGTADMMTDSDTERAKAAIERNRKPGNRPPAAPPRRPIVDQPQARPTPRP